MNMPQMPGMPSVGSEPVSPFAEGSVGKPAESEVMLDPPLHIKPVVNNPDKDSSSQVAISVPKKGIEVVALRKGFYNQTRMKSGDKFFIKSPEQFGDWFSCVDDYFEKKRLEFIKDRKAKK